jgi:hypothetical protein
VAATPGSTSVDTVEAIILIVAPPRMVTLARVTKPVIDRILNIKVNKMRKQSNLSAVGRKLSFLKKLSPI